MTSASKSVRVSPSTLRNSSQKSRTDKGFLRFGTEIKTSKNLSTLKGPERGPNSLDTNVLRLRTRGLLKSEEEVRVLHARKWEGVVIVKKLI